MWQIGVQIVFVEADDEFLCLETEAVVEKLRAPISHRTDVRQKETRYKPLLDC